jgi:hypothetical protein
MATFTYINLQVNEAERLLSLAGIANDLQACLTSCEKLNIHRVGDSDTIDAFLTRALVRYARCFKGGIRTVNGADLTSSFTTEELERHQFFLDYRDKHIAHSVNDFKSHRVRVWLAPEEHGRGINSVNAESNYLLCPDADTLAKLQELAAKALAWVHKETEAEQAKLKAIISQKHSLDELYSLHALIPNEINYSKISERRKR